MVHASVPAEAGSAERARGGGAAGSGQQAEASRTGAAAGRGMTPVSQPMQMRAAGAGHGSTPTSQPVQVRDGSSGRSSALTAQPAQPRTAPRTPRGETSGPRATANPAPRPATLDHRTAATSPRGTPMADVVEPGGFGKVKPPPGIEDRTRPMPVELQGIARGRRGAGEDYSPYIQHGPMYWRLAHSMVWGESLGPRGSFSSGSYPTLGPLPAPSIWYGEELKVCTEVEPPTWTE